MIPEQRQQVTSNLPAGVQEMYIAYSYYGRPRVMMTLQDKPRRQLMAFAVILIVFGPVIIALVSACLAMKHFYIAYGYAAGILVSTHPVTHLRLYTQSVGRWRGGATGRAYDLRSIIRREFKSYTRGNAA